MSRSHSFESSHLSATDLVTSFQCDLSCGSAAESTVRERSAALTERFNETFIERGMLGKLVTLHNLKTGRIAADKLQFGGVLSDTVEDPDIPFLAYATPMIILDKPETGEWGMYVMDDTRKFVVHEHAPRRVPEREQRLLDQLPPGSLTHEALTGIATSQDDLSGYLRALATLRIPKHRTPTMDNDLSIMSELLHRRLRDERFNIGFRKCQDRQDAVVPRRNNGAYTRSLSLPPVQGIAHAYTDIALIDAPRPDAVELCLRVEVPASHLLVPFSEVRGLVPSEPL